MTLWDTIIDILHPKGEGDSKPIHQTQIPTKHNDPFGDIDFVPANARLFSMLTASLYIFDDNEAAIKTQTKSDVLQCVMYHTLCSLDRLHDRIIPDPMIQIKYVNTTQQLSDNPHKRIIQRKTDGHNRHY